MAIAKPHYTTILCGACCLASLIFSPSRGFALDIVPFHTFNQSPIVQIYGLPATDSPSVLPAGRLSLLLGVDISSSFGVDKTQNESIVLDGEEYRTTISCHYGFGKDLEAGFEIPIIAEGGGILDAPIQGWHDLFGLPQGGRDRVPKNRIQYTYSRNGRERFRVDRSNVGIGDIRLTAGLQIYRDSDDPRRAITLRSSLKLPTGDSSDLHGSGNADFALWLSGREPFPLFTDLAVLWGLGGMVVGKGDILPELQREVAAFGTFGIGWMIGDGGSVSVQLNGNTPFYRHSSLREMSVTSLQFVAGGAIALTPAMILDLSFSEDIVVISSSPDFGITLALRTRF